MEMEEQFQIGLELGSTVSRVVMIPVDYSKGWHRELDTRLYRTQRMGEVKLIFSQFMNRREGGRSYPEPIRMDMELLLAKLYKVDQELSTKRFIDGFRQGRNNS